MTDARFSRVAAIHAERQESDGIIEGTLATNGEADDGHIVDVAGIEIPDTVPLTFGHDGRSGRSNLGSWLTFQKMGAKKMRTLGDQQLHGVAKIETEGAGDQALWRQDMNHMVNAGHIRNFSATGEPHPEESPVLRSSLPTTHPAYSKEAGTMFGPGLFFPRSILSEGAVVTNGMDKAAVIRSALASDVRTQWLEMLAPDLLEQIIERMDALDLRLAEIGEQWPPIERAAPTPPVEPEPEQGDLPTEDTPPEEPAEAPPADDAEQRAGESLPPEESVQRGESLTSDEIIERFLAGVAEIDAEQEAVLHDATHKLSQRYIGS